MFLLNILFLVIIFTPQPVQLSQNHKNKDVNSRTHASEQDLFAANYWAAVARQLLHATTTPHSWSQHELSFWSGTQRRQLLRRDHLFNNWERRWSGKCEVRRKWVLGWRGWIKTHLLAVCEGIHSRCCQERNVFPFKAPETATSFPTVNTVNQLGGVWQKSFTTLFTFPFNYFLCYIVPLWQKQNVYRQQTSLGLSE